MYLNSWSFLLATITLVISIGAASILVLNLLLRGRIAERGGISLVRLRSVAVTSAVLSFVIAIYIAATSNP
jgi:hypothetical protein